MSGLADLSATAILNVLRGNVIAHVRRRDWGELAQELGVNGLRAVEQAGRVGYAMQVSSALLVGASAEFLHADYVGNQLTGYAGDVGARLKLSEHIALGLAYLHWGGTLKGENGSASLPTEVRGGLDIVHTVSSLTVRTLMDLAQRRDLSRPDLHIGAAVEYGDGWIRTKARAGLQRLTSPAQSPSITSYFAGGGVSFGNIALDFTRAISGTLTSETYVTASISR